MSALYPYAYFCILLSIVLSDFLEIRRVSKSHVKKFFYVSLTVYVISFLFIDGGFFHKLVFVLLRDVVVAVVVAFLSDRYIKNAGGFAISVCCLLLLLSFYAGGRELVPVDRNGELLIDIKNENQISQIKNALAKYNPKMEKAFPRLRHHGYSELDDYYLLNIDDKYGDELDEIIEIIFGTDAADWVERNEVVKVEPEKGKESASALLSECVNDPLLSDQWAFGKMKMCELYELSRKVRRKKLAKIAILDTGVDSQHEDIRGNYVSTDKKYDNDLDGHGTHCAGVAGAVTNNRQGIASFFPKNNKFVRITGIKVLNDNGSGTQKSIIEGMIRALDEGADVLSLSLGGPSDDEEQKAYEEVIKYADKSGAVIVVAAGNSGDNARNYLPAGAKGVIAVSAVDSNLDKAPFSNYISELDMGIAAPGVNIHSTIPHNKYESYSGTSMAAPHVAGLVGLMKSVRPKLTTEQVFKILSTSGIETNDTEETGMFIQPYKALSAVSKRR